MTELRTASKTNPCPHCNKTDWCYSIGELSVCKRKAPPAAGWKATSKIDSDSDTFYAPDTPQGQKQFKPVQTRQWYYPSRIGKPLVQVTRTDDGNGNKKLWQSSWNGKEWVKGCKNVNRVDIPIYRYSEIKAAIANKQPIFIVEGETCADALWEIGIAATTNIGGSGKWRESDTVDIDGAVEIIICPDRDHPGLKHMESVAESFPDAKWLYAYPKSFLWHEMLPASQGADIADYIADLKPTAEDIYNLVEARRKFEPKLEPKLEQTGREEMPDDALYTEKAIAELYSEGHWIACDDSLYKWTGSHYQPCKKNAELRRISEWARLTRSKWATRTTVSNIWEWVLIRFGVDAEDLNPPGINCLNGIISIKWNGTIANHELLPHNPKKYYTYVSEVRYDPDIDPSDCDKLLSCLEPDQQKVFLQTIAASLDLATIRRWRGRSIRALLLQGLGNNGKDSIREAVSLLFGNAIVDVPITDFQAYDSGRKFPLAKLSTALISWSSENSSFAHLDNIQSLKRAITGETIDIEFKNENERPLNPQSVFLFNINEPPELKAGLEAIKSRWGVLRFQKTFKTNADPKRGEIEADARFRYDPAFMKERVVPAMLNKLLAELKTLAQTGIDYSCTEEALESIQRETNHLCDFAQAVGLEYRVDGRVYVNDLWQQLRQWYLANGTLVITRSDNGKEKTEWFDQARRGDKNVKGANQVYQRFSELFPKIVKGVESVDRDRRGQSYLAGIAITASLASHPCHTDNTASTTDSTREAVVEATTTQNQPCEAGEAVLTPHEKIRALLPLLTFEEKSLLLQKLQKEITYSTVGNKVIPLKKLETPPAPFEPGAKVIYDDKVYRVQSSDAAFTQLEGRRFAVPSWQCYREELSPDNDTPLENSGD